MKVLLVSFGVIVLVGLGIYWIGELLGPLDIPPKNRPPRPPSP